MSLSTVPFEFFASPYAFTRVDQGITCNSFPKLNYSVTKFTSCTAATSPFQNPARALCSCKESTSLNHTDACNFLEPVYKLISCFADFKPLFACRAAPDATENNLFLPFQNSSVDESTLDLKLDDAYPESFSQLSHNERGVLSRLFDAISNNYVHNINTSCVSEEASLKKLEAVVGTSELLPGWTLRKQFRPDVTGSSLKDTRDAFPMGQLYSRGVGSGTSVTMMLRGTLTVADIIADLDSNLVHDGFVFRGVSLFGDAGDFPQEGVFIHRGFFRYGRLFAEKALNFILDEMSPASDGRAVDRLLVTGHSLGGFLSQVVGFYVNAAVHAFARKGLLPSHVSPAFRVEVVSLAAATAGNTGFASVMNEGLPSVGLPKVNLRALRYALDPMTEMPCSSMPQCANDSWTNSADESLTYADIGEHTYGRLSGAVLVPRAAGYKERHLVPGKHFYNMRMHVCSYKCALEAELSGKESRYCSVKGCRESDYSRMSGKQHKKKDEQLSDLYDVVQGLEGATDETNKSEALDAAMEELSGMSSVNELGDMELSPEMEVALIGLMNSVHPGVSVTPSSFRKFVHQVRAESLDRQADLEDVIRV